MLKSKNKSTTILVIIFFILILAMGLAIGLFILQQNKSSEVKVDLEKIRLLDNQSAKNNSEKFLKEFFNSIGDAKSQIVIVREKGTNNLIENYEKNLSNLNNFICVDKNPKSYRITSINVKDGVATVFIEIESDNGKKIISMNLVKDDAIKVDNINCSPKI